MNKKENKDKNDFYERLWHEVKDSEVTEEQQIIDENVINDQLPNNLDDENVINDQLPNNHMYTGSAEGPTVVPLDILS
jgi:hypothetical protein